MTGNKNFDSVLASTVYDKAGEKVGKVEQIYISDRTDQPRWVSVKTGFFGTSHSLVPLAGARHSGDRLDVGVTKSAVKDAPHLDTEGGISAQEDAALLRHYGFTEETAGWNQYGKHAADGGGTAAATTDTGDRHSEDTDSLVRSEERLNVGTQREEAGRARLRKYVVTEEQTVTVPVSREEVEVVREPITEADAGRATIGEEAAEVTLRADRVVASKETVPVERVGLEVNEVTDQQNVTDTVRKERIEAEGVDGAGRAGATPNPEKSPHFGHR